MRINIGEGVDLDAQLVMTGRGCVIGQSGSGKSFLMGVVAEELCKLNLPFIVVDTEGEYHNLKNSFKAIWVSNSDSSDVNLDVDYGMLLEESITGNIPIIFDVSDTVDQSSYVYDILGALYDLEDKRHMPYLVMIEEADKLAPQVTHNKNNMVEEISVRGRKRGIGLLIATQRPANISKNVLSQCSYGFIGKLTIENDIAAIDILFSNRQLRDSIVRLGQGEFMPFGIGIEHVVKVKGREIEHYGSTPKVIAGIQSADINAIIGRLGTHQPLQHEKHISDVLHIPQKGAKAQTKPKEIEVVKHAYSEKDAIEYARKKASHRLAGMAGINADETVESVSTFYYPLRHLRILVPKRNSHKFIERYAFINQKAGIARIDKGLRLINTGIKPGASLTNRQESILQQLRIHGRSEIDTLEKRSGIKSISKDIDALIRMGSVKQAGKYYALNDMLKLSSKRDIGTISMESTDVDSMAQTKSGSAMAAAKLMFPGCKVYDLGNVYIEMYKITLRRKDKLRIFVMDSISFRDRTSDIGPF
ncbi:MAG: DUF87 domain-containing protein [Candidatus Micrarchaeaceae archaeon]